MKNIKIKPIRLLIIGMVTVLIGALAKIYKENYHEPILIAGLIIEIIAIILFIRRFEKIDKKVTSK